VEFWEFPPGARSTKLVQTSNKVSTRFKFIPATIDDRVVSIFIKREYGIQFVLKGSLIRLNSAALSRRQSSNK
jgi:hypothetical protein